MTEKTEKTSLPRREFLKRAGLATGAAGAAAVALKAGTPQAAQTASSESQGGYRETEHVRKYYDLARSM